MGEMNNLNVSNQATHRIEFLSIILSTSFRRSIIYANYCCTTALLHTSSHDAKPINSDGGAYCACTNLPS